MIAICDRRRGGFTYRNCEIETISESEEKGSQIR
jgi:hypothetical protein